MRKADRIQLAKKTLDALLNAFPDSCCSLDSDKPERLSIRGILSAQCTDVRVNITAQELFAKYPSMEDILNMPDEELIRIIKPCGLYKSKGKSVKAFADLYVNEWGGKVPNDVDALMKCPGVGKKIANLIVGEIYGTPAVVVDTHCKRVMYRIGITDNTDPIKVEEDICAVFPVDSWIGLGHMAVSLGRTYCTAQKPSCDTCPLTGFCAKRLPGKAGKKA